MSILKGALGGIGAGMGAMALLNEEKGGTFTSYPEPSRLKQLMGQDISRPETWGGSGENIWGDKYGKAAEDNDEFDNRVQEELTKAYKLYENGEMTNDEFKYIEASIDQLKSQKNELVQSNATFAVAPTTQEAIEKGEPRYKLMVMQDKNPFTKDLPQGDTMGTGDFR